MPYSNTTCRRIWRTTSMPGRRASRSIRISLIACGESSTVPSTSPRSTMARSRTSRRSIFATSISGGRMYDRANRLHVLRTAPRARIQWSQRQEMNMRSKVQTVFRKIRRWGIKGIFDYNSLQSLSTEARQKLTKIDPLTLAQASRIPGVSPSDINVLLVLMGR